MGASALEIIFVPVLLGVFGGIVIGMAMLAVMNAVEALIDRLGRRDRSIEAVHRATCVTPQRSHRPAVHTGRLPGVTGRKQGVARLRARRDGNGGGRPPRSKRL
jgi:hypothetical protein